jgi:hypothetical protein
VSARSLRTTHLLLPHALVALSCVLAASAVQAQEKPGGLPCSLTDPASVYGVPAAAMPGYLQGMTDATFRSTVKRITPDAGVSTSPVAGSWGGDTRHHYSKDQPWSADGAFYCLENRGGGSPSTLILDGHTFAPLFTLPASAGLYDHRWHPAKAHAHEMINVSSSGTELSWVDATTGRKTRTWTVPFAAAGFGAGEGNASRDGRFIALHSATQLVVIDMDPQPPYAPYPSRRSGPVYTFPPCSLSVSSPATCPIGNVGVSASGRYVDVKYAGTSSETEDVHRIYEVDPVTLAVRPHAMASVSLRCDTFADRPNGWIFGLKHADMTLDPFDGNEDVIVGGRSCPGSTIGHVVKVRLRDGKVTALTDPANESAVLHVSTRNADRPGWAYVSFFKADGKRFSDELVAVKLDGSHAVERYAHMHSATSGCYRCEQHPAPSPDGSMIAFASNWAQDCGAGCGSTSVIKDYVILAATAAVAGAADGPRPAAAGLVLARIWPNPSSLPLHVAFALPESGPARLELADVAGRSLLANDLGAPGAGVYEASLGQGASLRPGTYWLRLSQGERSAVSRVVILK